MNAEEGFITRDLEESQVKGRVYALIDNEKITDFYMVATHNFIATIIQIKGDFDKDMLDQLLKYGVKI